MSKTGENTMKIIDSTINELNELEPSEAVDVFNFIMAIKKKQTNRNRQLGKRHAPDSFMKVREALKNCSGSLSADIVENRIERI